MFGYQYLIIFVRYYLLWIYEPDRSAPNTTMYYPGDNYVDIVAFDVYVNDSVLDFHLFLIIKKTYLFRIEYKDMIK
jgi:beta-mannanase